MIQTTKKITLISVIVITLLIISSFVVAKGTNWYDKQLPSANLNITEQTKLISDNKYIWNSNSYWKSGNCYYFDLSIGYNTTIYDEILKKDVPFTNYTWIDSNRELICTTKALSLAEIETLQLDNVAWTLDQLGQTQVVVSEPIKTPAKKGENLKDKTISDASVTIDATKLN